jgi:putative heme degradation protein
MSEDKNLRRRLAADPFDVFRRVPLLGRIMIAVRDEGVVLERIGVVERVERDGSMLFTVGKAHDSEIDISRVSAVVVDYSSQMKGKVLPRIEFQDASGKIIFSVVGLEGADPFDAGLKIFEGAGVPPLLKPAGSDDPAKLDAADAGMQPLKAAREAEAEITIEMQRPGVTQRWRGLVPEINPAMGFVNIITSDFHLHLRGGDVKHWQRSAPAADGTVELTAMDAGNASLGLFLRGPASAFGAA